MRTITEQEVKDVLVAISLDSSERVNPTREGACVYTDPDNEATHCIAGEAFVRLDLPVPGPDDGENYGTLVTALIADGYFGEDVELHEGAVLLLKEAQDAADGMLKWGTVVGDVLAVRR